MAGERIYIIHPDEGARKIIQTYMTEVSGFKVKTFDTHAAALDRLYSPKRVEDRPAAILANLGKDEEGLRFFENARKAQGGKNVVMMMQTGGSGDFHDEIKQRANALGVELFPSTVDVDELVEFIWKRLPEPVPVKRRGR